MEVRLTSITLCQKSVSISCKNLRATRDPVLFYEYIKEIVGLVTLTKATIEKYKRTPRKFPTSLLTFSAD